MVTRTPVIILPIRKPGVSKLNGTINFLKTDVQTRRVRKHAIVAIKYLIVTFSFS